MLNFYGQMEELMRFYGAVEGDKMEAEPSPPVVSEASSSTMSASAPSTSEGITDQHRQSDVVFHSKNIETLEIPNQRPPGDLGSIAKRAVPKKSKSAPKEKKKTNLKRKEKEEHKEVEPPPKRQRLEDLDCEVCHQVKAKYRYLPLPSELLNLVSFFLYYSCPRCDLVSCSLPCSTKHKQEMQCSGKRDRTKFFKVSEMNDATLHNDMALLGEIRDKSEKSRVKSIFAG